MFIPKWLHGSFPLIAWIATLALGLSFLLRPRFLYDWVRSKNPEFRSLAPDLGRRNVRLLGLLFIMAAIFFCAAWMHNMR